ncbi:hypothetical protein OG352_05400 [Streptomyces sp. NBC_01485]|uniref:hypothetical protein n=1 Tax=Streptomyces sp. NBC_01485 TaxID=2903884 RepID=UPI002E307728|nr:hypothetical protein [Streptomyces sp. NBC_01485]
MAAKSLPVHHHGVLRRDLRTGRFVKVYTLTYAAPSGTHVRTLPARGIETVGRVISRCADRHEVWDIAVTDKDGNDVTFDFLCFT